MDVLHRGRGNDKMAVFGEIAIIEKWRPSATDNDLQMIRPHYSQCLEKTPCEIFSHYIHPPKTAFPSAWRIDAPPAPYLSPGAGKDQGTTGYPIPPKVLRSPGCHRTRSVYSTASSALGWLLDPRLSVVKNCGIGANRKPVTLA